MKTLLLTIAFCITLGALGPTLDDRSAERDQAAAQEYLQRLSGQREHFERAAQRLCGPQSTWVEVSKGVVQCLTRHGKPSGRKARVYPEAS